MELGGFDESLYPGSDYAMNINYAYRYGLIQASSSTYNYRIAFNESFNVGSTYADVNKKFHEDMMEHIKIPNLILKPIINSIYEEGKVAGEIWTGEKQSPRKHSILTYYIMRVCRAIVKAKLYKM